MNGVLIIDKPKGITSRDVVNAIVKKFNTKKVGHTGTLDPIATGVLPVFVGKATKIIQFLPNTDKTYLVGFKLGEMTDTFDFTGKLLSKKISNVSFDKLKQAISEFKGVIVQTPPKFSAVKINGVPAYKLARRSEVFKIKSRKVNIFEIYCTEFDEEQQMGKMYVYCSSGTYVRSICNDLGLKLGVGCVMTSLVRTSACGFNLNCCHSLSEIEFAKLNGKLDELYVDLEYVFRNFKKEYVDFNDRTRLLNGVPIVVKNVEKFKQNELVIVFFQNEILGVTRFDAGFLFVKKLLI